MKRAYWLSLLGISGTSLAGLLWGQSVLGQPEGRTLPLTPPPAAVKSRSDAKGTPMPKVTLPLPTEELRIVPEAPLPVAKERPANMLVIPPPLSGKDAMPLVPTVLGPTAPAPALPPSLRDKQPAAAVSYDVAPGKQQPGISIEWAAPTGIRVNQPMACKIIVRNTSNTPAQNVVVRHRLGQGVSCKASEPAAANEGGELVWNIGTLTHDQTRTIDLTLLTQTRGPLNCHATVTFTGVAAHQVQVREPQLAVKMTGPEKTISGENVTMLFAISNPGDGVAEAVKLKMILPEGLDHPRGRTIDFEVGSLAPKETRNLQLTCQSKGSGMQKCAIHISGDGGLNASDTTQFELLMPRLDIAMTGPKLRYLDRKAVYVMKITNPGNAMASNVEVEEVVPVGFKFHQASHGGQYHEATRLVTWKLGDLPPGQSKDISIHVVPLEPGEHLLVAHVKGARGLTSAAEVRTLVEGLPSLFIEVGHVDDPIEVGAETAFEIRLANTGTKTETNVEVICTLPEQLEFRNAKCSTSLKYRQEGRDLIFEPLPRLAPKADVLYKVQVRGVAPGDIRFRTRVRADNLKEPVIREESMRIYSDDLPIRPGTSISAPPAATPIKPITPVAPPMPTPPTLPMINDPMTIPGTPAIPAALPKAGTTTPSPMSLPAPLPTPPLETPSIPTPSIPAPIVTPQPLSGGAIPMPSPAPAPLPLPGQTK